MKKHQSKSRKDQGFTLVEVMVVMAIIALLVTVVAINVWPSLNKANSQKASADIRILEQAVEMYRLDMMDFPPESAGLEALVEVPAGVNNADNYRSGGYIKTLPNDPWGRPYNYRYPGDHGLVDIWSYGSDGEPGGEDQAADITNWKQ